MLPIHDTYSIIRHPVSGEAYAVCVGEERILAAAGPIDAADWPEDAAAIADWVHNQPDDQAEEDGVWLQGELERHGWPHEGALAPGIPTHY